MRKLLLIAVFAAVVYAGYGKINGFHQPHSSLATQTSAEQIASAQTIEKAFREHKSGLQVQGEGVVSKLLADDNDGKRHQRFILSLPSGQTLLVAHNIDLAPRIPTLTTGDVIAFNGVYEWNEKGGVIHWTHHDPAGRHQAGWLKHSGQTYQ